MHRRKTGQGVVVQAVAETSGASTAETNNGHVSNSHDVHRHNNISDRKDNADCSPALIWISVEINNQALPAMIDSGATPCCLARHCLNASPQLSCLPRKIYTGPGVIDANGKPMSPEFTINATLVLGHPEIRVDVDFLVFDGLPYSCIIGQSLLRKFTSWAICNNTHTLTIDCKSKLEFTDSPCSNHTLSLLTTQKITLNPGQIAEVPTRATGNILNAFRPLTDLTVLADGYNAVTTITR